MTPTAHIFVTDTRVRPVLGARRGRVPRALLARLRCWWRGGHEDLIQLSPARVWLRCQVCGRTTRGWPRVGPR
jgi:hypothetical protein